MNVEYHRCNVRTMCGPQSLNLNTDQQAHKQYLRNPHSYKLFGKHCWIFWAIMFLGTEDICQLPHIQGDGNVPIKIERATRAGAHAIKQSITPACWSSKTIWVSPRNCWTCDVSYFPWTHSVCALYKYMWRLGDESNQQIGRPISGHRHIKPTSTWFGNFGRVRLKSKSTLPRLWPDLAKSGPGRSPLDLDLSLTWPRPCQTMSARLDVASTWPSKSKPKSTWAWKLTRPGLCQVRCGRRLDVACIWPNRVQMNAKSTWTWAWPGPDLTKSCPSRARAKHRCPNHLKHNLQPSLARRTTSFWDNCHGHKFLTVSAKIFGAECGNWRDV